MAEYVDVHTHLTHEKFSEDLNQVIERAMTAGLSKIVVNGLEPKSNRQILEMAKTHSIIRPALGIYPLDAVCQILPKDFPFDIPVFDVQAELEFIRLEATSGNLTAIGECGLDGYYVDESFLPAQEKVFEQLIAIAMGANIPIIVHTRKCEKRAGEILHALGAKKVNFHCFGGRAALAKEYAEKHGWWFSIPANCNVNEGFQKMMKILPPEKILTETDAPYLGPVKGQRNEPSNVVGTVKLLGQIRSWGEEKAKAQVFANYQALFGNA